MKERKWTMGRFVVALAYAIAVFGLSSAVAKPVAAPTDEDFAKVEALYAEGISYYKAGAYDQAIERFKSAFRIYQEPNLMYNIARCYEALGDVEQAIGGYSDFLSLPEGNPDARQKATEKLKALMRAREQARAVPISPGSNQTPSADTTQPGTTRPGQSVVTVEAGPSVRHASRWPEWTLIGAGAASVVLGGVFVYLKDQAVDDFHAETDSQKKQDQKDAVNQFHASSIALLSIGGAALISGGLMFLLRDVRISKPAPNGASLQRPPSSLQWQISPWLSRQAAGGAVRWEF